MFDADLWREIIQSINKNRTRSLLSGFTIAFAILLFTILFGVANGLQNTFNATFADDAINLISIYTGRTSKANNGLQAGRRIRLKNEDFDYIEKEFDTKIQHITGRVNRSVQASFGVETNSYPLRAVHPEHQFLEKTIMLKGRYINQNDIVNRTKVAVIGRLVEEDLFLDKDPIGAYISLNKVPYRVVGVFRDDGGDNEERIVYTPVSTAQRIYGNNEYLNQIKIGYDPKMDYNEALAFGNTLKGKLKKRFNVAKNDQRAVRVRNRAEAARNANLISVSLSIIILVIGLGTLIAGIVGISNIMIFIVKERTKEIGIRKALGASPKSIVTIILTETIVITAIAGYIGLLIGVAVLKLATPILEDYFIKDPGVSNTLVLGATMSLILAGAIAGYIPAKKASKIKPIIALRND
jgi:putative ABC transport system permease protein